MIPSLSLYFHIFYKLVYSCSFCIANRILLRNIVPCGWNSFSFKQTRLFYDVLQSLTLASPAKSFWLWTLFWSLHRPTNGLFPARIDLERRPIRAHVARHTIAVLRFLLSSVTVSTLVRLIKKRWHCAFPALSSKWSNLIADIRVYLSL